MTKRILSLLAVMCLLMTVFAACSKDPVTSDPTSTPDVSTSSSDVTDTSDIVDTSDVSSVPSGDENSDNTTAGSKSTTTTTMTTRKVVGNLGGIQNNLTTQKVDTDKVKVNYSMPLEKNRKWTLFISEHPSQPIKKDSMKWNVITEMTNVTLDVDVATSSTAQTKLMAASASGKMYDISIIQYAWLRNMKSSVFLDVTDLVKTEAPTYWSLVGSDPSLNLYKVNGKFLGFSMFVSDTMTTGYETSPLATSIRKDILDKNNLKVPTTWQEWFDVMKRLKGIYKDSTPFSGRGVGNIMEYWMQSLGGYGYQINYYSNIGKYSTAVVQDNFRQVVQFMASCYAEGILDPNFTNSSESTCEQGMVNGKIFCYIDNGVLGYRATNALQQTDKDAKFVNINLMTSHLNGNKKSGFAYTQATNYASMYCISKTAKNQTDLIHFLDWCYSDEGMLVNNCGKEGVTYKLGKDGEPYAPKNVWSEFKDNAMPEYAFMSKYGLGQCCFSPRVLSNSGFLWEGRDYTDEEDAAFEKQKDADIKAGNYVALLASLQPDVDSAMQSRIVSINKYISHELQKFIKGERPLSELNAFQSELKKLGIDDVLKACNDNLNG